jgi:hypothetical protein
MLGIVVLILNRGGTSDWTELIVIVVSLVVWLVVTMDWDSLVAWLQLLRLVRRVIHAKFRVISSLIVLSDSLHAEMLLNKLYCLWIDFWLQNFPSIRTLYQSFSFFLW